MEKVHKVIKALLKPQIDMNTELKKAKNGFEKYFFKLMIKRIIQLLVKPCKMWENKLVTTEKIKNYFVSELNYQTIFFSEN